MRTVIKNVRIVDAQKNTSGDIAIEGTRIAEIGRVQPRSGDSVIDGEGLAAIPGLVNTHTHAAMTLLRGYGDDMPLHDWLRNKIWPLEKHLTADHVYAGTRLACLEMLKSGTTAFNDMYFFAPSIARAAVSMGIRAAVSAVFFDVFFKQPIEQVEQEVVGLKNQPRIIPAVGPHAPYTVTLEGIKAAAELAERHDARIHCHLAETASEVEEFRHKNGRGVVETLDALGFLSSRLIAAHCLWLTPDDIRLLGQRQVNISHCPTSNLKLCSGFTSTVVRTIDLAGMRAAGINVTLGTDGAASNNSLDMFEAMKLAALLQKHHTGDPKRLPAREAFEMATLSGARALALNSGLLEPGYLADIVLVDLLRPAFIPGHDLVSDLVYAANGSCVRTVLIDGQIVLRDGTMPMEKKILQDAVDAARDLVRRSSSA